MSGAERCGASKTRDETYRQGIPPDLCTLTMSLMDVLLGQAGIRGVVESGHSREKRVKGVVLSVLPGRFGIVAYSPRIDEDGTRALAPFRTACPPPESRGPFAGFVTAVRSKCLASRRRVRAGRRPVDLGTRQARHWSTDSISFVAERCGRVRVLPLRRAFQTASLVFQNSTNPGFVISPNRRQGKVVAPPPMPWCSARKPAVVPGFRANIQRRERGRPCKSGRVLESGGGGSNHARETSERFPTTELSRTAEAEGRFEAGTR